MPNNKAQIDIVGDNADLDKSLQDTENNINKFGKKVSGIFSGIAATVDGLKGNVLGAFTNGAVAVKEFTTSIIASEVAVNAFNSAWYKTKSLMMGLNAQLSYTIMLHKDLNKVNILTGQTAGYSSKQLQQYAEHLEKITKFSANATESAMQLIMHFRNIHGTQFLEATKAAQDLSTTLRMDLNSAAQLVASSLHDPLAAMQQLTSVNVFFDEQEKKLVKTLVAANKIVDAQNIILGKLSVSFGGAAKAAGETFLGRMERLKNVVSTVATTIGERLLTSLNNLFGAGNKGKQVFDAFLKKIEEWGQVAIATVDVLLPKIIGFTQGIQINFEDVYNWLIDQTINVFTIMEISYQNAGKIFATVNEFIFASFTKVWSGISKIFTDIIPKSFMYMVDVFINVGQQIVEAWRITVLNIAAIWGKLKSNFGALVNNLLIEWDKFKIKIAKWGIQLGVFILGWWFKWIPGVSYLINKSLNYAEKRLNEFQDSSKLTYIPLTTGLGKLEFENPFKGVKPPDFSESIDGLKGAMDLSKEWGDLLNGINSNFGDNFDEATKKNKEAFDQFMDDVKKKKEANKDLFPEPKMNANKRMADEKKPGEKYEKRTGMDFLEAYKQVSSGVKKELTETEKNTTATKENTKTLNELRKERKKAYDEEKLKRTENKKLGSFGAKPKAANQPQSPDQIVEDFNKKADKFKKNMEAAQKRSEYRMNREIADYEKHGSIGEHPRDKATRLAKDREQKRNAQTDLADKNRENIHKQAESHRQQAAERGKRTKLILDRMKRTKESFAEAERNINNVAGNKDNAAQQVSLQNRENSARVAASRQSERHENHLKTIAINTHNTNRQLTQINQNTKSDKKQKNVI